MKKIFFSLFILLFNLHALQAQFSWKQKVTNTFKKINSFDITKYVKGYQIKLKDTFHSNLLKADTITNHNYKKRVKLINSKLLYQLFPKLTYILNVILLQQK